MRFRTTFLLLLLLAGLGAYVYWVEVPKAEQEAKKKTLFEFETDDATEVSLVFADREISLVKNGKDWRLTKPIDALADATTVNSLVSAVADCEVKKELAEPAADLATYGLDKPFVTLSVKLGDKSLPAVAVGKTTPVGFSTYVQPADSKKILLTNAAFRSGLDKQVKDLRDKTIANFADDDVQRLEILREGQELSLVRKDGAWSMERPGAYPVDAASVRNYLSSVRALRATDFPADNPTDLAAYGLDAPKLRLRLLLGKDNSEKQILVGNKQDEKKDVYVSASGTPTVYSVSEFSAKELDKHAADFRDKTVLAYDRDQVARVVIRHKDGTEAALVRGADEQWRAEGTNGAPATALISQFLNDLHDLKGHEILSDNPGDAAQYGLDQPLLVFTLLGEESKRMGAIRVAELSSAEGKKEYAAAAEGSSTILALRDYLVTRLNKQAQDFVLKPTPTPGAGPAAAAGDIGDAPGDDQIGDEPLDDAEGVE